MQERPFKPLVPGRPMWQQEQAVSEYNRLLEIVERLLRLEAGSGLNTGGAGPEFRDPDQPFLWVKITEGADSQGCQNHRRG